MTRADVIVVGGGPAGSTCARQLVSAGAKVIVIDRAHFPRDKCCAGWITPHVVAALGLDVREYGREHTLATITGFATSVMGRRRLTTSFPTPVSFAIRRCEFDDYLLRRCGAAVECGHRVRAIERQSGCWRIDAAFEAPMLVGAGGHFCPVARMLNPGRDDGIVVAAQECEFRMSPRDASVCGVSAETPELFFSADRRGYGWCVRKNDFLNIGFGRIGGGELPGRVAAFVAELHRDGRVPAELPQRWPGHAYLLYARPTRRYAGDGVLLVGDAAGFAHPVSGEGILGAVESGVMAARAITRAGGDRQTNLEAYRRAIERRYGRPGGGSDHAGWLPAGLVDAIGERLLAVPAFVRRVLLERWFLHRHLPVLDAS